MNANWFYYVGGRARVTTKHRLQCVGQDFKFEPRVLVFLLQFLTVYEILKV